MKISQLPGFKQAQKQGYALIQFDLDGTWAKYQKGILTLFVDDHSDGVIYTKIELLKVSTPTFCVEGSRSFSFQEMAILHLADAHQTQKTARLRSHLDVTVLLDDLESLHFMATKLNALLLMFSAQHPDSVIDHKERARANKEKLSHWQSVYGIEYETDAFDILSGADDDDLNALALMIATSAS
jgi:hypothetical protein